MKTSSARKTPSLTESVIFRGKAFLLQQKRRAENLLDAKIKRSARTEKLKNSAVVAESKTVLWTEKEPEEKILIAGKIHNLRLAVKQLNGVEIAANETFSFWANVGQANQWNGYVKGRELREGCIIPNVGGGLCQLSNALYDAALKANFEIVERHAHTQVIAGSLAEQGRDATVFWNYVDLRFKSTNAFRIEATLTATHLIVKFKSIKTQPKTLEVIQNPKSKIQNPNSCMTCGIGECFRNVKVETNLDFGRTAFLVDEFMPEFDSYLQNARQNKDLLFLPLDGNRFKKPNYAWNLKGFAKSKQSFLTTAIRAYKSRKLAAQGASRQKNLLEMSQKLAESYAKNLPFDALHVVVSQNLLPFLWQSGALGGRTFDVLMNALPISELQKKLDFAASLHTESPTLGDFRADEKLVAAEIDALKNANRIITPHSDIAALFGEKSILLDWKMPASKTRHAPENEKFTIVFPASTVGRKGCYELRAALRGLEKNVKLIILGAELEGANFWQNFETQNRAENWLETGDLVVLPAFVEHKPRRLLLAAANQIPVIASSACGVDQIAGIEIVEPGNTAQLTAKVQTFLSKKLRQSDSPTPAQIHEQIFA